MLAKIIKIKDKSITIERQDGKTLDIEKDLIKFKYSADDIIKIERDGDDYAFSKYDESNKATSIDDFFDSEEDESKNTLIKKNSGLKGIGGWLLVYLISSLLGIIADISIFSNIGVSSSRIAWKGAANLLFSFEFALVPVITVMRIIYAVRIIKRKKDAIHRTIFLHSLWLLFNIAEAILTISMFSSTNTVSQSREWSSIMASLIASGVTQIIWIIYFAKSKRVKNTLTK